MARPRAQDHTEKREAIYQTAARLFAEHGYDGTSMSQIAEACGVSKALLYHYYDNKEAVLFDIVDDHLERLLEAVGKVGEDYASPREKLEALCIALLEAYRDADAEHKVQINDLKRLPHARQDELKAKERELVAVFSTAIRGAVPSLAGGNPLLKPVTMSLFGMLNWQFLWFRPDGPISRRDFARLATQLVIEGATGVELDDLKRGD